MLEKVKLELTTPHRDFDKNGRVMVESKKDLAKRDVPSPNVADAFIMAFAPTDTAMDIWEEIGSFFNKLSYPPRVPKKPENSHHGEENRTSRHGGFVR